MVVGYWTQFLQQVPLLLYCNSHRTVILSKILSFVNNIHQWNWQCQYYNTLPSQQFAYYRCFHLGSQCPKAHFICHHYSWNIWIGNLSCHKESYYPNLVCLNPGYWQARSWILIARNQVIDCLANWSGIQQSGYIIETIDLKLVVAWCNGGMWRGAG